MTKNPVVNALAALLYIIGIASVMNFASQSGDLDNSIIAPIAFLSLFTFSAAVMGYIFFYQPIQLYLDGQKKTGVNLFLKTLFSFGLITAALVAVLISGIFR